MVREVLNWKKICNFPDTPTQPLKWPKSGKNEIFILILHFYQIKPSINFLNLCIWSIWALICNLINLNNTLISDKTIKNIQLQVY